MTVRSHQVLLTAIVFVALLPRGAGAAFVYTNLTYSTNNSSLAGYVLTSLDSWEVFPTDFYYGPCECWVSQENYPGVAGILRTPSNQVVVATGVVWGYIDVFISMSPFRPWEAGNWVGQGSHGIDSWYYRADYPYTLMGNIHTPLGTTQAVANVPCVVPSGESTTSAGWDDSGGRPTVHRFQQRLLPTYVNFAGSQVTEAPTLTGNDGCWHPEMRPTLADPFNEVTGGSWTIVPSNYWNDFDYVGFRPGGVEVIQQVRARLGLQMPCYITVPQQMWITSCPGAPTYQTHALRLTIDTTSVYVERAGVGATRSWQQGPPPPPPGAGNVLAAGQRLHASDQRVSTNGQYTLVYQGDGNLVLYGPGGPTWATQTGGAPGYVEMQGDGNLVVYNSGGAPVWDAGSAGLTGTSLVVQDDGNLVIYTSSGVPVWSIW